MRTTRYLDLSSLAANQCVSKFLECRDAAIQLQFSVYIHQLWSHRRSWPR